ncbi:MAG TPA: ABC transporter ATP-binding protein [Limnochordia bacterium]|nr:ABC transporter ATP-binding protein [Limnochordia bacterium]
MHTIWRLRAFLRPYRTHMLVVIAATVGVTALNLVGPWIIRELMYLVRTGTQGDLFERIDTLQGKLLILAAIYAAAQLLRSGLLFVTNYIAHVMAWSFVGDLRVALYHHLQKLSLRFYHDKQTGEVMSRLVNDTNYIEPLIAHNIPDLIVNSFLLIGITAILVYLDPVLALWTLVPIPLLLVVVLTFSKHMRAAFKTAQERLADFNAILQDNISGIKEIQIFTRERHEGERVKDRSQGYTANLLRALKIMAVYHPSVEFLGACGTLLIVYFGGKAALGGRLEIEDLVAFLMYLSMFYQPVMLLARMNEQVQMALAGAERAADLLLVETDVKEAKDARSLRRVSGRIAFEGVDFHYGNGKPVLRGVSFVIAPGESLALVGPTGVGKSTIASLIPRFYDPTAGRVTLDGHDLRELDLRWLRRQISMVLQDTFLFNGTVLDNIRYGSTERRSEEDVIEAAKIANAHEFILSLPDGYQTHIGERGVKLSGGQKQRLSIARAVLKDAPILILDEATSAIDVETEALIQEALQSLMRGRTTLIIAHRLSTVRNATAICALEGGRIVQRGDHAALLAQEGLYRRLYNKQIEHFSA